MEEIIETKIPGFKKKKKTAISMMKSHKLGENYINIWLMVTSIINDVMFIYL